jgi:lipid A ethanolaminephosphotransferase
LKPISTTKLLIVTALFFITFTNLAFFRNILGVYPISLKNGFFLLSLPVAFTCVNITLLSLVCFKHTTKPILIILLVAASLAAYFMDMYNVIIDDTMVDNIVKTDLHEAYDLLSTKQLMYLILFGILPAIFIYRTPLQNTSIRQLIKSRLAITSSSLLILVIALLTFGNFYASFFREHKSLRLYANPSYLVYSTGKFLKRFYQASAAELKPLGIDARIAATDSHRELIVFVVGETARADRLSINGYGKATTPRLAAADVISFTHFEACGTSTAVSAPCMFSVYGQADFSKEEGVSTENVLDVLQRSGVNVVWLDNNSDSKGVANRIDYQDYKTSANNPQCDDECRDMGMLAHLQEYIDAHPTGDIFIVLHQMGNHGPAYYKRYPPAYETFKPVCKTNQLEDCSSLEISNAYDNALLYTDAFLGKTIDLLRQNTDDFEAALLYASDHGESLGENGLYLHGMPRLFAPETQTHVPVVMWFSDNFDPTEVDIPSLKASRHKPFTHDAIFHTILGLMEIETGVYQADLDLVDRSQADTIPKATVEPMLSAE